MMIRVALFGVVTVIVVGATIIVADRLINPAETPNETITSRFPDSRGRPSFAKRSRPSMAQTTRQPRRLPARSNSRTLRLLPRWSIAR